MCCTLWGVSLMGAYFDTTKLDDAEVTDADFRGAKLVDPRALADLWARSAVVDDAAR
jgi:uncharacterized protein YjbI with pentapeptide repeats